MLFLKHMASKAVRNKVAACRLSDVQWDSIRRKLSTNKIHGASTPGLLARKLLLDWDDGELKYRTKEREVKTREIWQAEQMLKSISKGNGKVKSAARALSQG